MRITENEYWHAGLDEAGLGPLLGPLTIGLAILPSSFLTHKSTKFLPQDSKKIYRGHRSSLHPLEEIVLIASFWATGTLPETFGEWLDSVTSPTNPTRDPLAPWYLGLDQKRLPLSHLCDLGRVKEIGKELRDESPSPSLGLNLISAFDLNQSLKRSQNKGTSLQEFYSPLLQKALSDSEVISLDRQGGRRRYGDWLNSFYGGGEGVEIVDESAEISHYRIDSKNIRVLVKGESQDVAIALASVLAKYAREGIMESFNRYWQSVSPSLKATAGYYQDGLRFCRDLEGVTEFQEALKGGYLTRDR